MSKSREGEKCKAKRWGVGAALAVTRPTALLVTLRRGDPRGRPREGQSPSPTHPMIPCRRAGCPHLAADGLRTPCKTPCHCETSDRCHWLWQSASPVPRPPCLKGAGTAKPCLGDSSSALLVPLRRGGVLLPTVVPTDSRPLSCPPIGALPRNRLAASATGGASPISPPAGDRKGRPYGGLQVVQDAGRCGERSERVAAVKILSDSRKAAQKFWAPQQGHRPLRSSIGEWRCRGRPPGRPAQPHTAPLAKTLSLRNQ